MICEITVKKYCCEDISLIENYQEAVNDTEMWECHHRLEIIGEMGFSVNKLKELGYYWNRPACELVFLSKIEHHYLHHNCKHRLEETKKKISNSNKGKSRNVGINNPNYGNHFSKPKFKWLTPEGEIKIMAMNVAKQHHPDWVLIE